MNRRSVYLVALIVVVSALAGTAAAGTERSAVATHRLNVQLGEWAVVPSAGLVTAGRIRVTVHNFGELRHELDIVPTERWGQTLGLREGRAAGEDAAPPIVVAPGQTKSATVRLDRGFYELLDNMRGHYAAGDAVAIVAA
jgi:uncharacterized cupredoxin-like copper-binding protein